MRYLVPGRQTAIVLTGPGPHAGQTITYTLPVVRHYVAVSDRLAEACAESLAALIGDGGTRARLFPRPPARAVPAPSEDEPEGEDVDLES